jgi:two-component system, cell cycle sensor histidine kinase and response regulator CckA
VVEKDSRSTLRQRAEAMALENAAHAPEDLEPQLAMHELRVHQIELEMQNEELRRVQEELEVSRARYFDLYDMAPVGYLTLSEQGLILEANLTAAKLLGVARGALVKLPLSRFILPDDQDIHYLHRKQLLETGAPQVWELRLLKKDSGPFWARVQAAIARDADGAAICRVVVSDIGERKRAEVEKAKLEIQDQQLQKAESLGRMAGAIAHRFNNYLMAVMGNLELGMGDQSLDTRSFQNLTHAMEAARQAAHLSTQMLAYLGQALGRQEPLDLSNLCRRGLPALRTTMPKDVALEMNSPAPVLVVSANASQIREVLTNLVTNAWESCAAQGTVRLTLKTVTAADIPAAHRFPIGWQPHGDAYACLEVVDNGCGIAEKDLEKLFDPFFSTKLGGRGLGLPVVLGIVRAHSGAITADSEPGRGSVFQVFLPLSAEAPRARPKLQIVSRSMGGGTVLIVEDEKMIRSVIETMLLGLGFSALHAEDGVAALEVFWQHKDEIRCVLCDLTMPRMNGWETLAALRKLAPGLPVILASGYDEAHAMAGDHPELPQAFLGKPYRLKALREALSQALQRGGI